MDDQGFDFQKAPERREKGRFEIPPWEREAFEDLQRKLDEGQAQQQVSEAAEVLESEIGETPEPTGPGAPALTQAASAAPVRQAPSPAPGVGAPVQAEAGAKRPVEPVAGAKEGPSEAEMSALLARLASEEPRADSQAGTAAVVAAAVVFPIGAALMIWGVGGLVKASAAQLPPTSAISLAAGVMIVFGAGFVVCAAWLLYRFMRQRGVI